MSTNNVPGFTDTLSGLNATWYSSPITVKQANNIGYAIRTTGTMAGTWTVQYSNDFVSGVDYSKPGLDTSGGTADAKWDTYNPTGFVTPTAATGSAQTFGIQLDSYEYAFVRLKFTLSSGTGTAIVAAQMKG